MRMRILGVTALLLLSSVAQAQEKTRPVSLLLENFYDTTAQGTNFRLRWFRAEVDVTPKLKLTGGSIHRGTRHNLDENHLQWTEGNTVVRVGRFRTGFGLSDWDTGFYLGFPSFAQFRSRTYGALRLIGTQTGADVRTPLGDGELQVGIVDLAPQRYEILSPDPSYTQARYQRSVGPVVVGVNTLTNGHRDNLYLLDYQWAVPQTRVLGEVLTGRAGGKVTRGAATTLLYRLPRQSATTLTSRVEQGQRTLLGVKQTLSPEVMLQGTSDLKSNWRVQLFTSLSARF